MRLVEILTPESLRVPIVSVSKEDAIRELIDHLPLEGETALRREIQDSVLERERSLSTGIGDGIAIPHGKADVSGTLGAFGVCRSPIPFDSIDGHPVRILFLVVTRPEETDRHLLALGALSAFLTRGETRDAVLACKTSESLWNLLQNGGPPGPAHQGPA
jgi:mannitol/fructose-specific phosphotransferase system IIA component (Ntr-type)